MRASLVFKLSSLWVNKNKKMKNCDLWLNETEHVWKLAGKFAYDIIQFTFCDLDLNFHLVVIIWVLSTFWKMLLWIRRMICLFKSNFNLFVLSIVTALEAILTLHWIAFDLESAITAQQNVLVFVTLWNLCLSRIHTHRPIFVSYYMSSVLSLSQLPLTK